MIRPDRRLVLTGALASLAAGCSPAAVSAAPAAHWAAYETRLRQGIAATRGQLVADMPAALLAENNAFRKAQGLPALHHDPELALAAHAHVADMQARGYFAHNSPDGFTPIERAGLLCRSLVGAFGENLAWFENSRRAPTARQISNGWQGSPGHRENMLKPEWTHVGHAAIRVGARTTAAAVFGQLSMRLAEPLPLRATGADLNTALSAATPAARTYMLSEPAAQPDQRLYVTVGSGPRLDPGAYRLWPLRPRGVGTFDVMWGPIFFVD